MGSFKSRSCVAHALLLFAFPVFVAAQIEVASSTQATEETHVVESQMPLVPSGWARPFVFDGIAYFLFEFPFKVERFDMDTRAWLPTASFTSPTRSIAVDESGVYISFSDGVSRFDHNVENETALPGFPNEVAEIRLFGDYLIGVVGTELQTFAKVGGAMIHALELHIGGVQGLSVDAATGNLFYRTRTLSPADIIAGNIDSSGFLTTFGDSPYHGSFPGAEWAATLPGGTRVADSAGVVYEASGLQYVGSLGGLVSGLTLAGTETIVLRGGSIVRLDGSFKELGVAAAQPFTRSIVHHDGQLFEFGPDSGQPAFSATLLTEIQIPNPGPIRSPTDGGFAASDIKFVNSGRLVFLESERPAIHRFDLAEFSWGESSALPETPVHLGVDPDSGQIRVGYSNGRVGSVPPLFGPESHFINQPDVVQGLTMADGFTMACDWTGLNSTHWYYDSNAQLTDRETLNRCSVERTWTWSPSNRRIYFYRYSSPTDLVWESFSEQGIVVDQGDSPYHGDLGTEPPLRVHPSHAYIVLGSGDVVDGETLELIVTLPVAPAGMAWVDNTLYTLTEFEASPGNSALISWTQDFEYEDTVLLAGNPLFLTSFSGVLYGVTEVADRVHVIPVTANLDSFDLAVSISVPESDFEPGQPISYLVEFVNHGAVQAEADLVIAQSFDLINQNVVCEDMNGLFDCSGGLPFTDTRNMEPGEWARITVSGLFPASTFLVEASIVPRSGTDTETANNHSTQFFRHFENLLKSGFE